MTKVSIIEKDVLPINGSVGEILLWLEGHVKREKRKFHVVDMESILRGLIVGGMCAAVVVTYGRLTRRTRSSRTPTIVSRDATA